MPEPRCALERALREPRIEFRPEPVYRVAPGDEADVPPSQHDLELVIAADQPNQIARGGLGYDVVVLGCHVEERRVDRAEVDAAADNLKLSPHQLVVAEEALHQLPRGSPRKGNLIHRPAVERR